jgi:hypothetical protein
MARHNQTHERESVLAAMLKGAVVAADSNLTHRLCWAFGTELSPRQPHRQALPFTTRWVSGQVLFMARCRIASRHWARCPLRPGPVPDAGRARQCRHRPLSASEPIPMAGPCTGPDRARHLRRRYRHACASSRPRSPDEVHAGGAGKVQVRPPDRAAYAEEERFDDYGYIPPSRPYAADETRAGRMTH